MQATAPKGMDHLSYKNMRVGGSQRGCLFLLLATVLPVATAPTRQKIGPALALSEADWQLWMQYVLKHHSRRMYCLLMLTGTFALQAGEAAMLRREDFYLNATPPRLRIPQEKGRGQSPGDILVMLEQIQILRAWIHQGIYATRTKKANQHTEQEQDDGYFLPDRGRLLVARSKYQGKKVKSKHLSYHAVWCAVRGLANAF